jgi:acyl-CoA thioesterase-2
MAFTNLQEVLGSLDIEELEVNVFRGFSPQEDRPRVFGGQVAAQALVAAFRTVPEGRVPHSLHSYFLRPGRVDIPILFMVDRIRDGRSFTTRRVVAIQNGAAIYNMSASFQVPEEGPEHWMPMPDVPGPEGLPSLEERLKAFGREMPELVTRPRVVEMRWCQEPDWKPAAGQDACSNIWMRAAGEMPDDPFLHTCVLVYASDYTLIDSITKPHGMHWSDPGVMSASLDHSMWFHAPVRADRWWLYAEDSPAAGGARGLARGSIYGEGGRLVCSVAQEMLFRTSPAKRAS